MAHHMHMINRAAVTILAKQPFIDWINSTNVSPDALKFTIDMVNDEPQIFLVKNYEDLNQQKMYITKLKPMFFEVMLDGYYQDETAWPEERSEKVFDNWFDLITHSMILDVEDHAIEQEEY
jgi:hypothetical protein